MSRRDIWKDMLWSTQSQENIGPVNWVFRIQRSKLGIGMSGHKKIVRLARTEKLGQNWIIWPEPDC